MTGLARAVNSGVTTGRVDVKLLQHLHREPTGSGIPQLAQRRRGPLTLETRVQVMRVDQNVAVNEGGHAAPRVAEALPRGTAGCARAPACALTQLIRQQRADALRTPRRRGHRDVGLDPHSRQLRGHSLEVNRRRQFDRAAHHPCRQAAGHRPLQSQWITRGTVSVCASSPCVGTAASLQTAPPRDTLSAVVDGRANRAIGQRVHHFDAGDPLAVVEILTQQDLGIDLFGRCHNQRVPE